MMIYLLIKILYNKRYHEPIAPSEPAATYCRTAVDVAKSRAGFLKK